MLPHSTAAFQHCWWCRSSPRIDIATACSLGVSLSTASQWSFNALIAATFPALRLRFGARNVLNGFALVSLLSWAFTYYFVPETKGKALEDIGAKGE